MKSIREFLKKYRPFINCDLSNFTIDFSYRRWYLCFGNTYRRIYLHISYGYENKFFRKIERYLETYYEKYFEVSF